MPRGRPKGARNMVNRTADTSIPLKVREKDSIAGLMANLQDKSPLHRLREEYGKISIAQEAEATKRRVDEIKDERFIKLYAHGMSVEDASNIAGFSTVTAWRRMSEQSFRERVEEEKKEVLEKLLGKLSRAGWEAVEALIGIMNDETAPHAVRLNATLAILDRIGLSAKAVGEVSGGRTVIFETNFTLNQGASNEQQERARLLRGGEARTLPEPTIEGEFSLVRQPV